LLRERGMPRVIGAIGLLAGALPAAIVFVVGSHMTDAIVVGILLAQAIWNLAAATLLIGRRRKYEPTSRTVTAEVAAF